MEALAGEHHAGVGQLLVIASHRSEELPAWHDAGLGVRVGLHDDHDSHELSPVPFVLSGNAVSASLIRRTRAGEIDMSGEVFGNRLSAGSPQSRVVHGPGVD